MIARIFRDENSNGHVNELLVVIESFTSKSFKIGSGSILPDHQLWQA